jgi:glucosamine-6-phosphate deaminase
MKLLPHTTVPTYLVDSQHEANEALALEISSLLSARDGRATLGLATGSSPIGLYTELVRRHRAGELSLKEVQTFNLDEYIELTHDHPASYRAFMSEHLFRGTDLDLEKTHFPPSDEVELEASCANWESSIQAAGGIDWQLLGVGRNGHIGFNEPGSPFDSRTRRIELAESTREANARFFESIDEVPRFAVTMGVGTILEARRLRVLAFGDTKAHILERVLHGEDDESIPLNALRKHPDAALYIDAAAAARIA